MSTKTFSNVRTKQKHDVESNWLKATGFAPLNGELIIYDVDETHNKPRLKIGDGEKNVNLLPFIGSDYTLPQATGENLGGVKIGYPQSGKNYPVVLDTDGKAYVNVPWTDTDTHQNAFSKFSFIDGENELTIEALNSTDTLKIQVGWGLSATTNIAGDEFILSAEATKTYVDEAIAGLVNSAPETLDTLYELSLALGNDPNFATTITNLIGNKVGSVDASGTTPPLTLNGNIDKGKLTLTGSVATAAKDTLGVVKTSSTVASTSGLTASPIINGIVYYKNTTYSNMTPATASAAGIAGLVPAPAAGKQTSFLRGDGTWVIPTNTTYTNFVKSGSGAAAGLVPAPPTTAGTAKYLREDGTWTIPPNDTYNAVTISADGLMTSTDKSKLDYTNIAYGTCSTAAATAAKVITVSGNTNWELTAGSRITIKFDATNTAQSPKFNVNGTGEKSVWYNTALITTSSLGYAGTANRPMDFVYDGTQYIFVGWSLDNNTTYSNASLGQGYGTCSTAAATIAKVVTLSSYSLVTGGIVAVKFTYAVPASATLNVNSKGAKPIYYRGAAITANVINAGDIATFIYNGTQYHLLAIDRSNTKIVDNANKVTNDTLLVINSDATPDKIPEWYNGTAVDGTGNSISVVVDGSASGDYYINTSTNYYYVATATNTWKYLGSLRGTVDNTLNSASTNPVQNKIVTAALNNMHPVGSFYISANSTSPALLFGGTWEQIEDKFLFATGTYNAGATGGEMEHTLTINEMPSHNHAINLTSSAVSSGSTYSRISSTGTYTNGVISNTGGGLPHNNMPPYLVVYIWERIA